MWDMAKNSIILLLQGRLFQSPGAFLRQAFIGAMITAGLVVALSIFAEMQLLHSALIAGFVGGLIQPYLFKNLKYA